MFFMSYIFYIQLTSDEDKKQKERDNRRLMAELVGSADMLTMVVTLCRDVEDDNSKEPGKLDTELLRKIVTQMRVMVEMAKESSSTLLELDRRASKKENWLQYYFCTLWAAGCFVLLLFYFSFETTRLVLNMKLVLTYYSSQQGGRSTCWRWKEKWSRMRMQT